MSLRSCRGLARMFGAAWAGTTPLRQNAVANFVGRAWISVLGFLMVPVYLHLMGIESYGLVGLFATLHGLLGLFDLGLGVTINRELARLSASPTGRVEQRHVLRTLEVCYWVLCAIASLTVVMLAPVLARHWIDADTLTPAAIERALRGMGVALALQLPFSFYQGALMGLERQVTVNGFLVGSATVRSLLTALVLWKVSPTIQAFVVCQLIVSAGQSTAITLATWRALGGMAGARFSLARLRAVWVFAGTVFANTAIGVALTQVDKVLLTRLLSLEHFGYYVLASTVATAMWQVIIPLNQALYPRFAQLFERQDLSALARLYHRACQVMSILLAPLALTLMCFSFEIVALWTGDARIAAQTAVLATLLVAGTTLNGLASVPGYLQSAAGWPQLVMYTNLISALVLVPALILGISRFGAVGAAVVWLVLNLGYVAFSIPIMHRRLLRGELRRWYVNDVGLPVAAAAVVTVVAAELKPALGTPVLRAGYVLTTWAAALLASTFATAEGRALISAGWKPSRAALTR